MGGRLALVVGSECDALGELGFVAELTGGLYERLSRLGGWQSAIDVEGPLLDPTVEELKAAVAQACSVASERQATLLISFLGHGVAAQRSLFFLLAKDSDPSRLNSDTALNLGQNIIENLIPARLDGLIVLVDACEAGAGVEDAHRWIEVIDPTAGRIEVLAAANDGDAYNGCFTRTMLAIFDRGMPQQGAYLLPGDLRPEIASACTYQVPRQLSSAVGGDPGLWLVPNISRADDAVFGRPSAGFVDLLTRGPAIGATVRDLAADVFAAHARRLRMVVGPPGCGKSTLMSLLIRPSLLAEAPFTSHYVNAAVFLSVSSTTESFIAELTIQLLRRLAGYKDAMAEVAARYPERSDISPDAVELAVLLPLELVRSRFGQITIIVDGLDQPDTGTRDQVVTAIAGLTQRDRLAHVRVIVSLRENTGIENILRTSRPYVMRLPAPTDSDIITVVHNAHRAARDHDSEPTWRSLLASLRSETSAGGWLLARLMVEIPDFINRAGGTEIDLDALVQRRIQAAGAASAPQAARPIAAVLGILAAAGSGPALPLELLDRAISVLGIVAPRAQIRDLIANLGVLISRGNPGTHAETLGLAHTDFALPIQRELARFDIGVRETHRAILAVIESVDTDSIARYARGSAVRHYLETGDSAAALDYLEHLDTVNAADNRDRWESWMPLFDATVGEEHPDAITARQQVARWRGECGDISAAITEFERVLTDHSRVHGSNHPGTLAARRSLARWRGESGDIAGAITEFEQLLTDCRNILGPDHPDTLDTRRNLARWRGESGDIAGAITEFERLLTDCRSMLRPDHSEILGARHNLARWRGESGDIAGAITEFEQLLSHRLHELGQDHPYTLSTRHELAHWRGELGDTSTAIAEFERLLVDRLRILGPDHPSTLDTRDNLADRRGESGDTSTAIAEFERLLVDRLRILGPEHPDTLGTRHNLARWRGESGDFSGAVIEYERSRTVATKVLGPDHPAMLTARNNLGEFRGESGDVAGAIAEFERLLSDCLRVMGPDHPNTLGARHNLARWRGESGDVGYTIREFERLLADRLRVLGPDHPDTYATGYNLALWRSGQIR
ncbi:tetratricopeptide repeat protein [Nocardia sp. NPDC050175]|uniref:tetratricopeptide repeat protein n=1 Tax=Nocardia sp. NPDC050175 TaxID=3364317 RepID=UPI0037B67FB0